MKKTVVLFLAFLFTAIFNYSSGRSTGDPIKPDEPNGITTLVINADVTVVLVNNEKATLQAAGGKHFTQLVTLKKSGDTVVIGSTKNRNLKGSGIVYVPANQLRNIQVNSGANVRSLFPLRIPKLDVVVNGACTLAISNIGELNIAETKAYLIDKSTKVSQLPAGVL
ncbi:MAG: hypothetical protein H7122_02265 [Chitinophagaceae bacterium]|nr:hypothetical protein [Chitinophagaceae bacterium]